MAKITSMIKNAAQAANSYLYHSVKDEGKKILHFLIMLRFKLLSEELMESILGDDSNNGFGSFDFEKILRSQRRGVYFELETITFDYDNESEANWSNKNKLFITPKGDLYLFSHDEVQEFLPNPEEEMPARQLVGNLFKEEVY